MSVMCRLLKYCVSHTLYAAMTRLEEVNKEVNMWSSVRCLGYLSSLNFLIAICLGLYVRWEKTAETIILVIFILGLFVLGMASIFYYYFNMEKVGLCLHLWFGFLIGLLCFLHNPALEEDAKEKASSYMLVASVVLRALWALLERLCGCYRQRPLLITSAELLELMGFAAASTALLIQKSVSLAALAAALATLIVNLRVKSYLAVLNLVGFAVITGEVFFKSLKMSTNPFALGCFFSRLVCEPLLDVYFSGLSVTERWQPVLRQGGFWRRLSLLPLVAMETAFLVLAALKMASVERWYVVIPIVSASSLLWVVCHVVFLVTLWAFHSKLSGCQRVCPAQRSEGTDAVSLDRVMASRGMRHFCLISERLVMFSLVSTGVLAAVSWQESNSLFLSMLLLVLALESLCHGLFKELGSSLGGTMLGYAMVIPTNYCSPDGQPTLLPPDQVQDLNLRSTSILNNVQRFFSHHMVEPFGCDYSTSGLGGAALRGKLRAFLEARTADGPRHDTYLLFYSGHTHRSGEWALAGGDALRLDELVQLWREKNAGHCSRLIVLLDTENSMPWVMAVPRVEGLYVAVQGARLVRSADPELQAGPQLGDFTAQWVDFNCNPDSNVHWAERGRVVVAAYGVSKWWGDYSLHLPTESDVADHWSLYFPRWTNQVVQLSQPASGLNLFWLCGLWERFLRRLKLAWCPPAVLDTGQGFKLVRS